MSIARAQDPLPDYAREAGAAAIGARLRRLSERLDGDARRLYVEAGFTFEQRWLGILDLLSQRGAMSVGELATALGISHPSVSQSRHSLVKAGLIEGEADGEDARRKLLRLSPAGETLVARLRPFWATLDRAAIEVEAEAGEVLAALERLEQALARRSLYDRVCDKLND